MKHLFRKLLITAFLVVLSKNLSMGQGMPVYDNTSFITLTKGLVEAANQTAKLVKTVQFLKEQKDRIVKVTNAVKTVKEVEQLIRANTQLIQKVNRSINTIINSEYISPDEVTTITDAFSGLIDASIEDVNFVQKILASNFFKMSDAERLKIISERKKATQTLNSQIDAKINRYRDIISFREMQDQINHREITQ